MIVYRLAPVAFADDLSGEGARLYGGRWNPVGVPLLYASISTALALLEILVNVRQTFLPPHHRVVLKVPDELIPAEPPLHFEEKNDCRVHGAAWVEQGRSAVLAVRSAILPGCSEAFNLLINPRHPGFRQVEVLESAPLEIDPRLLGKSFPGQR